MKKFIRKIVMFWVIFILALLIKKHITPYYLGDKIYMAKYKDFKNKNEDVHKFNSVFFGSSRIYRHVNSVLLDFLLTDYQFSTYNFASGATYNPESYFLYNNFINDLDSGDIKYAFLELQPLHHYSSDNCNTTKASYWNTEKHLFYSINYINKSNYPDDQKLNLIQSYSKSYIYGLVDISFLENIFTSNNIKELGQNGFYPLEKAMTDGIENNSFQNRWKSFHADTSIIANRIDAAKAASSEISFNELNEFHLDYLTNLIRQAHRKGIHILFIIPPILSKNQYLELLPLSKSLPNNNLIKIYSYPKYQVLYKSENSFDRGHLNSKGADIFTKFLAEEFNKIQARKKDNLPE